MNGLTGVELAAYYAELAETYRGLLSTVAFVSVERRREFRHSMVAYQNLCAELMAQASTLEAN